MNNSRHARVEDEDGDTEMGISLADLPEDTDHYINTGAGAPPEKVSTLLAQFERKKFAASIAVPTDDVKVRQKLRSLNEPITLFGEGPAERRSRLREILTGLAEDGAADTSNSPQPVQAQNETGQEYFTEGSLELKQARSTILGYSLPKAKRRIAFEKAEHNILLRAHVTHRKAIKEYFTAYEAQGSQVAADRPLGGLRFSPDGQSIIFGDRGGSVKMISTNTLEQINVLRGHTAIVSAIDWYPSNASHLSSQIQLGTGGGEGKIHLWDSKQNTPAVSLIGHSKRVSGLQFHPLGNYLASASHDTTWRFWDIETTNCLLEQDGHGLEVHTLSINDDGSLITTGGMDSIGRVWDLRTGKIVMYLDSHMGPIYSLDWSSNSHQLLSGSADGFLKCWDVRAVRELASIGAHTGGVTDIRWFKGTDGPENLDLPRKDTRGEYQPKYSGSFVVTGGMDNNVKIWSANDWSLVKSLKGHDSKVTGIDVTFDARWIASAGQDRTIKIWGRDDGETLIMNS